VQFNAWVCVLGYGICWVVASVGQGAAVVGGFFMAGRLLVQFITRTDFSCMVLQCYLRIQPNKNIAYILKSTGVSLRSLAHLRGYF
jgi:hypothetical protein